MARPYLAVKMAMSLDGAIAARPGVREWLSGEQSREFVRSLRIAYDAVMVGAGTVARRRSAADRASATRSSAPVRARRPLRA